MATCNECKAKGLEHKRVRMRFGALPSEVCCSPKKAPAYHVPVVMKVSVAAGNAKARPALAFCLCMRCGGQFDDSKAPHCPRCGPATAAPREG